MATRTIPRRCADCGKEFRHHTEYYGFEFRIICRDRKACKARAPQKQTRRAAGGAA